MAPPPPSVPSVWDGRPATGEGDDGGRPLDVREVCRRVRERARETTSSPPWLPAGMRREIRLPPRLVGIELVYVGAAVDPAPLVRRFWAMEGDGELRTATTTEGKPTGVAAILLTPRRSSGGRVGGQQCDLVVRTPTV